MHAFNNLGAAIFLTLYAYPYFVESKRSIWVKAITVSSVIILARTIKVEIGL